MVLARPAPQPVGRPVDLVWLDVPRRAHPLAHLGRAELARRRDHRRRDPQPARELLVGEHRADRRVGVEEVRLEGVEPADELGERRRRRERDPPVQAEVDRRGQPPGHVRGCRRGDRRDPPPSRQPRRHAHPVEHPHEVRDELVPLRAREHEDAARAGAAAGRHDAVLAAEQLVAGQRREVALDVGPPQTPVGDPVVPALHERVLLRDRQRRQVDRAIGEAAERLAVDRRARRRVPDDRVEARRAGRSRAASRDQPSRSGRTDWARSAAPTVARRSRNGADRMALPPE